MLTIHSAIITSYYKCVLHVFRCFSKLKTALAKITLGQNNKQLPKQHREETRISSNPKRTSNIIIMRDFAGTDPLWFQGAAWTFASRLFGEKRKREEGKFAEFRIFEQVTLDSISHSSISLSHAAWNNENCNYT